MNKIWLRKMIWSYIPLFLVVFSFLAFFFLQAMVEQNRKNAKESNEVFAAQLLQSVEVSLKTVDHMVIRELLNNKLLASYYEESDSSNVVLSYEVLKRVNELKQEVSLIDSFYLYRYSDGTIFSGSMQNKLDQFEDREFARSMSGMSARPNWTNIRRYQEFSFQNPRQVISVVHEVPVNSGTQGLFVINIDISSFRATVSSLYNESSTFVNIFDRQGNPIYADNLQQARKVMASLKSSYTGWSIESGMNSGLLASSTSAFSSVWFAVGVLVFICGLVLIIYITRANYKPLEELVVKLNHTLFSSGGSAVSLAADEFAFIESAINNFAAQSKLAEREFSKAAVLKRKNAFSIMIYGDHEQRDAAEASPFEGLSLPTYHALKAVVIEVDNPEQTFFTYSGRDRSLFKFVISSVVNEMVQQRGMAVWLEWTSPTHLTGILFVDEQQDLTPIYESIIDWVAKNLKFTVTIGVGRSSSSLEKVRLSYEEACSLLHFKAVLGTNRIIRYTDAQNQQQKDAHEHLRTIHEISTAFRQADEGWRKLFRTFFDDIRADKPTKAEIVKLMNYMLAHLELHLSSSSREEYQMIRQALEEARQKMESFDTLDEMSEALYVTLDASVKKLQEVRESRHHYHMLQDVKEYIEREYANPDLSLDYLSEKFSISAKYLSRLFKESFGENFLDSLMSIRIGIAKELLLQNQDSVQEVGEKVGYPNAATFRRVFRKVEGVSPQDYRSRSHHEQNDCARRQP